MTRRNFKLTPDAPFDNAAFGRVTEVNLWGDPITDAGAASLARPDSGLNALAELDLWGTQVKDAETQAIEARWSEITIYH